MQKKSRLMVVLCCLLYCTACDGKIADNSDREVIDQTNTVITSVDAEKTLDDYIEIATLGCNVVKEHEYVQQDSRVHDGHITYRVNKVTCTKQQGGWVDLSGGAVNLDNQGKITDDMTYIVVDVTVRQDGEFDFWWNSFYLSDFTEDNLRIGPREMVSASILCSDESVDLEDRDVYQYTLPDGKNVKTSLIFTVDDHELNEEGRHFLLEYNPTGAGHEFIKPEDYSMVFLESMEVKDGRQGSSE